jgi:hypothetical protein
MFLGYGTKETTWQFNNPRTPKSKNMLFWIMASMAHGGIVIPEHHKLKIFCKNRRFGGT